MKALSTGLLAIAIFVVGVGFFRLWFVLSSPASEARNERVKVNRTVDTDKAKQDAKVTTDKATGLTGGTTKEAKADGRVNDNLKSIDPKQTQNASRLLERGTE
jgi:hypothetical protein